MLRNLKYFFCSSENEHLSANPFADMSTQIGSPNQFYFTQGTQTGTFVDEMYELHLVMNQAYNISQGMQINIIISS